MNGNVFLCNETLKSAKIIKIFNADKLLDNRFHRSIPGWINHSISLGRKRELASPMSEFLGAITFLIITWYGGYQILILPPAKSLATSISNIQKGEASLVRVMDILDADVKVDEIENPIPVSELKDRIEFKNVGFYYNKENLILKNFNLSIPKGSTVALVGQSGSGKTTIANLLARFYDVTEGAI
ncbi:hypothetical protein FQR65_LT19888 [Abscondita terminalis]|nr:hypothetical protein FQR65_LT19888 [Abscondita terminalis]